MHRVETRPLFDTGSREKPPRVEAEAAFERARVFYRAVTQEQGMSQAVEGHDKAMTVFKRVCRERKLDWAAEAMTLLSAMQELYRRDDAAKRANKWVPNWPYLNKWVKEGRWLGVEPMAPKAAKPIVPAVQKPVEPKIVPVSIEERRRIREQHEQKIGRKLMHENDSEPAAGRKRCPVMDDSEGDGHGPRGAAGVS